MLAASSRTGTTSDSTGRTPGAPYAGTSSLIAGAARSAVAATAPRWPGCAASSCGARQRISAA